MNAYFIWEKGEKRYFDFPPMWHMITNAILESEVNEISIEDMLSQAIDHPSGTLPLSNLVEPDHRITIVMDDMTRPTPKKKILSYLIDKFDAWGVKKNQIDILFGLGTHRPVTEDEIKDAFGESLFQEIRFSNHDCRATDLVPVGQLESCGELKVNPLFAQADVKIAIGSIIPHVFNGFGGGAKLILPGISNYESIRDHHIALMLAKGTYRGNIIDNPFYAQVCEAAQLSGLDFIINTVFNSRQEVCGIVAGHFREAHQMGSQLSIKENAFDFDQPSDVTIVSAYPLGEGAQIMKAIDPAVSVTKQGGAVIFVGEVQGDNVPEQLFQAFDTALNMAGHAPKKLVMECLKESKLIVPEAAMDFNCALNMTLLNLSRVSITLVSPGIKSGQAARFGFSHADSLEEAIKKVSVQFPQATVNIIPAGAMIIPRTTWEMNYI